MSCGHVLKWHELIPIVSFIIQRGRCRKCKSAISIQYPLLEFLSGLTFLLIGTKVLLYPFDFYHVVFWILSGIFWSTLLLICFYDWKHKIIPEIPAIVVIGIGVLAACGLRTDDFGFSFEYLLGGFAVAAFPAFLWLISRGRWIGLGDAKLLLGIGLYVGPALALSTLMYAFWSGAIFSLLLLSMRGREFTMKSEIPFGPFIILGAFLAYFFNLNILTILLF